MSDLTSKPSLGDLPVENLEFIIPNPFDVDGVKITMQHEWTQRWLPFKRNWAHLPAAVRGQTEDALDTLRALSATSRQLRALALSKLWAVVQLASVAELSKLCQVLRASPGIAQHIRSFTFVWRDIDPCGSFEEWTEIEGTLLDFAFVDRFRFWEDLRLKYGREVERCYRNWCFTNDGRRYLAPGEWPSDEADWSVACDRRTGGIGPDDKGEDELIKSAEQFRQCVVEVAAKLGSLGAFGWNCPMAQMPAGALDALRALDGLTSLAYEFPIPAKDYIHALPLWELARNLEDLTLLTYYSCDAQVVAEDVEKQDESELASFEIPEQIPTTNRTLDMRFISRAQDLQMSIVSRTRTIITAVRGGHLKRLYAARTVNPLRDVEHAFAIPTLLPCWLEMEEWFAVGSMLEWQVAAATFRPLLAHASLWLDVADTSDSPRQSRILTRQDVQSLDDRYTYLALYDIFPPADKETDPEDIEQPLVFYISWLKKDAELAQEVADVWNAIVERGETGKQDCVCVRC